MLQHLLFHFNPYKISNKTLNAFVELFEWYYNICKQTIIIVYKLINDQVSRYISEQTGVINHRNIVKN